MEGMFLHGAFHYNIGGIFYCGAVQKVPIHFLVSLTPFFFLLLKILFSLIHILQVYDTSIIIFSLLFDTKLSNSFY